METIEKIASLFEAYKVARKHLCDSESARQYYNELFDQFEKAIVTLPCNDVQKLFDIGITDEIERCCCYDFGIMGKLNLLWVKRAIVDHSICLPEDAIRRPNKLNLYKYTSSDPIRPILGGVFHDNGAAVASDGYIIVIDNKGYNPLFNGKVVDKAGGIINGTYPNYKIVCDIDTEGHQVISTQSLASKMRQIKKWLNEKHASVKKRCKVYVATDNICTCYDCQHLLKAIDAVVYFNIEQLTITPIISFGANNNGLVLLTHRNIDFDESQFYDYLDKDRKSGRLYSESFCLDLTTK